MSGRASITATTMTNRTHEIGARVLGTYGPGTVTGHTTMFGAPFEWVRFDGIQDDDEPCPAADLHPLANFADMAGEACRWCEDCAQWVRI